MHINKIHKIDGVNLVKPLDIFAKLLAAIQMKYLWLKTNTQIKAS
tara:strand:+ start:228 stop:362 length:135 start_codon:yes stop_codon:yes gene_type:complete